MDASGWMEVIQQGISSENVRPRALFMCADTLWATVIALQSCFFNLKLFMGCDLYMYMCMLFCAVQKELKSNHDFIAEHLGPDNYWP